MYALSSFTRRQLDAGYAASANTNHSRTTAELDRILPSVPRGKQFVELDFRTKSADATLFSLRYGSRQSVVHVSFSDLGPHSPSYIQIKNGTISYGITSTKLGPIADVVLEEDVSDGRWHRLAVDVNENGTQVCDLLGYCNSWQFRFAFESTGPRKTCCPPYLFRIS